MKEIFYLMLVALTVGMFTACDDDNGNTPQVNNPEPKERWDKTLRGDNQALLIFPSTCADYWEYTYSYRDNPNIDLCLTGKFPKSRFFNSTVYNDEIQIDVSSIEDVNIQPDGSSINLYVEETDNYGASGYMIYIIPANTPVSVCASMKNIYELPEDVSMVSIFMRLYLVKQYSGSEYGGVDTPAIQAFNVTTDEKIDFPKREACNIHESLSLSPMDFSADLPQPPPMHAPLSLVYPNSPAEYLSARIKLSGGEVATFRFTPPTASESISEYATADVRYQFIYLGSAETYSYASVYGREMPKVDKEDSVTFIIADAGSTKLPDLQAKAEASDGTYVLTRNRKEQGGRILALYRNMMTNESYPHSTRKLMESVSLATVGGDMNGLNLMKMIAMPAMGNWGPQGYRLSGNDFLSDSFNYTNIRRTK